MASFIAGNADKSLKSLDDNSPMGGCSDDGMNFSITAICLSNRKDSSKHSAKNYFSFLSEGREWGGNVSQIFWIRINVEEKGITWKNKEQRKQDQKFSLMRFVKNMSREEYIHPQVVLSSSLTWYE